MVYNLEQSCAYREAQFSSQLQKHSRSFLICFRSAVLLLSQEIISSSNFPSPQECDYLADEATLKDGMQAACKPCVSLSLFADHLNG